MASLVLICSFCEVTTLSCGSLVSCFWGESGDVPGGASCRAEGALHAAVPRTVSAPCSCGMSSVRSPLYVPRSVQKASLAL
jgi:hypothetical protein